MKAYRLRPLENLPTEIDNYVYDVDEDFTSKKTYILRAKKLTDRVNKKYNVNFKCDELFEKPQDIGYRYCTRCQTYYWGDDRCECE